MNFKHFVMSFMLLVMITGCSSEKAIEQTIKLKDLHYENFTANELSFEMVDGLDTEVYIKGTSNSCEGTKIENQEQLKLFVDFSNIQKGDVQKFPIYVKYGETVCDFEVSPKTVTFEVTVKE